MRSSEIYINNDGTVDVLDSTDYVGEHRATALTISLNSELLSNDISYYTLCFKPGAALKNPPPHRFTSDKIPVSDITDGALIYKLPSALTQFGSLDIQVAGHCVSDENEVTEIVKSPVFRIVFEPSIDGEDELFIEQAEGFTALIHTALAQMNLTIDEADELCDKINEAYENGELNGPVIMPHMSPDGTLSWSNDAGFENPEPINLLGPQGDRGERGEQGEQGIQGEKGEKGDKGEDGKTATINGFNAVTINADGDLEITQSGEDITFSFDSIKLYHTLPETAEDGDICLYSPANVLTAEDSGKLIYIDWNALMDALSQGEPSLWIGFYDDSGENFGWLTATYLDTDDNGVNTSFLFEYTIGNECWVITIRGGEIVPEESYYTDDNSETMTALTELPEVFALPIFSKVEAEYTDVNGDVFYAPLRLMLYRGGWYEHTSETHTHENYWTLTDFRCEASELEADNEFPILPDYVGVDRLKFRGYDVRYCADGAVVQKVEELERDDTKYLRLWLYTAPLVTDFNMPEFIDIPVELVTERVEENTGSGLVTNSTGLELDLGSNADLSAYYTKTEIDDKGFITKADIPADRIEPTETSAQIQPNTDYSFGECETLTLNLAEGDSTKRNEYMFTFISGATATVLTLPDTVQWVNELTVEANKRYEISIVDNIALWCAVDYTAEVSE